MSKTPQTVSVPEPTSTDQVVPVDAIEAITQSDADGAVQLDTQPVPADGAPVVDTSFDAPFSGGTYHRAV